MKKLIIIAFFAACLGLSFSAGRMVKIDGSSGITQQTSEESAETVLAAPDESGSSRFTAVVADGARNKSAVALTLPPDGARLVTFYDELVSRARSGDAAASMRLYRDVAKCRNSRARPKPSDLEYGIKRGNSMEVKRRVAGLYVNLERRLCFDDRVCNGISDSQLKDPFEWLVEAAESGDMDARVALASGEFLVGIDIDSMQHVGLFRAKAQQWLEEAVAAGHFAAFGIYGQALAMSDPWTLSFPLAQLLQHDAHKAYVLIFAASKVPGSNTEGQKWLEEIEVELTASDLVNAKAEGERLYRRLLRHYADSAVEMARYSAATTIPYVSDAEIVTLAPECVK